ncbi:MAG: hypothetical protein QM648_02700, partial [Solirubrobacterales bacterium]
RRRPRGGRRIDDAARERGPHDGMRPQLELRRQVVGQRRMPRHALEQARRRLDSSIALLHESGIDAEGEVGDANPVRAFEDAVSIYDPDGVLVSTHPEGRSNWLERGEVEKIRDKTNLPVEHVVVDLEAQQGSEQLSSA